MWVIYSHRCTSLVVLAYGILVRITHIWHSVWNGWFQWNQEPVGSSLLSWNHWPVGSGPGTRLVPSFRVFLRFAQIRPGLGKPGVDRLWWHWLYVKIILILVVYHRSWNRSTGSGSAFRNQLVLVLAWNQQISITVWHCAIFGLTTGRSHAHCSHALGCDLL